MMRSTNRNPRIDINDFGTDISLRGGQYKTKQLYHFMDSIHQTKEALEPKFCKDLIESFLVKFKIIPAIIELPINEDPP